MAAESTSILGDIIENLRPPGVVLSEEYKKLYEATRKRAHEPKQGALQMGNASSFHDYVLFSANTGLRPDEARRLQFRDVTIVEDDGSSQTILEIEVRGRGSRLL